MQGKGKEGSRRSQGGPKRQGTLKQSARESQGGREEVAKTIGFIIHFSMRGVICLFGLLRMAWKTVEPDYPPTFALDSAEGPFKEVQCPPRRENVDFSLVL